MNRYCMTLVSIAALVGGLAACGGSSSSGQTITGSLAVTPDGVDRPSSFSAGDVCTLRGGFANVTQGSTVTVKDEKGKTVATGSLGQGQWIEPSTAGIVPCVFDLTVKGVPKAANYTIGIGSYPTQTYSFDELNSANWKVNLSLG